MISRIKRASFILVAVLGLAATASASVFLGGAKDAQASPFATRRSSSSQIGNLYHRKTREAEIERQKMARVVRRNINPTGNGAAMAIPGMYFTNQPQKKSMKYTS